MDYGKSKRAGSPDGNGQRRGQNPLMEKDFDPHAARYPEGEDMEYPDTTPLEIPLKFTRPPTMEERMRMFMRGEMSRQAREQGLETFQEADDFDTGDDEDDPLSGYEVVEMGEEPPPPAPVKPDNATTDKKEGEAQRAADRPATEPVKAPEPQKT